MTQNKIWLITGISSGLGKALAQKVMEKEDFVIGTFRNPTEAARFNEQHQNKALGLLLDLADPTSIDNTFTLINERFGRLDVLVNNAGFGMAGAIEETSLDEARAIFETNFFGTFLITRSALPLLRKQKKGHIIQISSHGGFKAFAGFGLYNASKFALEGLSEALAQEVAPLGIKCIIVQPGPFRTRFAGSSLRKASITISDYNATAGLFRDKMEQVNGKQEGDPEKAAAAIFQLTRMENPPLRLPLGKIALGTITAKLESVQKDLDQSRPLAESAVFNE